MDFYLYAISLQHLGQSYQFKQANGKMGLPNAQMQGLFSPKALFYLKKIL
jgi:hypothetical protein